MEAVKSKYAIVAGAKPTPKYQYDRARDIIEGVSKTEKNVVELRRRQYEIEDQMEWQSLWLCDSTNWGSDLWAQRQQIHHDRKEECADIIKRVDGLIEILWGQIGTLDEGSKEKKEAIVRLMSWEEPPF